MSAGENAPLNWTDGRLPYLLAQARRHWVWAHWTPRSAAPDERNEP